MHLHAAEFDIWILRRGLVGGGGELQRNTKLVVALTGRDLRVRVRIDVGIDANGDRRLYAELAGDVVDARQLGLALDVERENAALERQLDLGFGFADAGKHAALHVCTCREHATEFAGANEIERGAEAREMPQHREAGVGLHRVAELDIEPPQAASQTVIIVSHRRGTGNIGWCAVEARDFGEIDRLTL